MSYNVFGGTLNLAQSINLDVMCRYYRAACIACSMHCMQRGLVTIKLSVRLSVCLSNAWIVTEQNKLVPTFLYHMKDHSS